jgi:hypothetical protein
MMVRTIVTAIGTAFAFATAGSAPARDGQAETVTQKINQATHVEQQSPLQGRLHVQILRV